MKEGLAGRRIGPYQLVSRIGVGGMGEVCKARDTTSLVVVQHRGEERKRLVLAD